MRVVLAAAAAALALCGSGAWAVTYQFTATVSQFQNDLGLLGGAGVGIGSTITGTFTYDPTESPDSTPSCCGGGTLGQYNDPFGNLSASIGSVTSSSAYSQIQVIDNSASEGDSIRFSTDDKVGGSGTGLAYDASGSQVGFISNTGSVFSSVSLPASLSLSDFETDAYFFFSGRNDRFVTDFLIADITRLELAPVPLPAALPLLLAGLGALGLVARRRARSA